MWRRRRGSERPLSWAKLAGTHLVSMAGFMINRRWQDLGRSVAVKLAESKRLDFKPRLAARRQEKWRGGSAKDQWWQRWETVVVLDACALQDAKISMRQVTSILKR